MDLIKGILCSIFITALFLFSGCITEKIICEKPYLPIGTQCCLDDDNDGVCDRTTTTTTLSDMRFIETKIVERISIDELRKSGMCFEQAPKEINGKKFCLVKNGTEIMIVYDDKVMNRCDGSDPTFGSVYPYTPLIANGKGAYATLVQGRWQVIYDCKKSKTYSSGVMNNLSEINGKLTYIVRERTPQQTNNYFVVYDGTEGERYIGIFSLTEINGELAYIAQISGQYQDIGEYMVVYGGNKGKIYAYIETLPIKTRLVYAAAKLNNQGWVLVVDGKETTPPYDKISNLEEINGKINFDAVINGTAYNLVEE